MTLDEIKIILAGTYQISVGFEDMETVKSTVRNDAIDSAIEIINLFQKKVVCAECDKCSVGFVENGSLAMRYGAKDYDIDGKGCFVPRHEPDRELVGSDV